MATQDSRIKIKRSTISGTAPTVAPSDDHTQPSPAWSATDIYKGELFINQADNVVWSRGDDGVFCIGGTASLTVASADVLTGNTTPIAFGITVPTGYAIELIGGSVKIDYGTTPYATNMDIGIRTVGATDSQLVSANVLNASLSCTRRFIVNANFTATDTQLINGADIEFYVPTGNPTAGDSDITVYVNYRLIST